MDPWSFYINQRGWIKKERGSKKSEWKEKVKTIRVWEKNMEKRKKEVERRKRVMVWEKNTEKRKKGVERRKRVMVKEKRKWERGREKWKDNRKERRRE